VAYFGQLLNQFYKVFLGQNEKLPNNRLERTAALSGMPFACAKVTARTACFHTPQCLAAQPGVERMEEKLTP
jgi:hypothetical protein